jgi:hypothetical protein
MTSLSENMIGNINSINKPIFVRKSEVIIDSLLIPANYLVGLQQSLPYFSFMGKTNEIIPETLTIKVYINSERKIGGNLIYTVNPSDGNVNPKPIPIQMAEPAITQSGVISVSSSIFPNFESPYQYVKYGRRRITTFSYGGDQVGTDPNQQIGIGIGIGQLEPKIESFRIFDTFVNQFIIVTAQCEEKTVEVTPFLTILDSNGLMARPYQEVAAATA